MSIINDLFSFYVKGNRPNESVSVSDVVENKCSTDIDSDAYVVYAPAYVNSMGDFHKLVNLIIHVWGYSQIDLIGGDIDYSYDADNNNWRATFVIDDDNDNE